LMKNAKTLLILWLGTIYLTACGLSQSTFPAFDELIFDDSMTHLAAKDGHKWTIDYEYPDKSTFAGVVRHISHWHNNNVPFMSHDLLITSGDYADPAIVNTWVFDHKYFYHYKKGHPDGKINLLHIFPASPEVYQQLQQIRKWDNVSISGREILKINLIDENGENAGYFKDKGCNTILVTNVTLLEPIFPEP